MLDVLCVVFVNRLYVLEPAFFLVVDDVVLGLELLHFVGDLQF